MLTAIFPNLAYCLFAFWIIGAIVEGFCSYKLRLSLSLQSGPVLGLTHAFVHVDKFCWLLCWNTNCCLAGHHNLQNDVKAALLSPYYTILNMFVICTSIVKLVYLQISLKMQLNSVIILVWLVHDLRLFQQCNSYSIVVRTTIIMLSLIPNNLR